MPATTKAFWAAQGPSCQPQHSPKCLPNPGPGPAQSHCKPCPLPDSQVPSYPRAPSACPLQSINAPRVLLTLPYLGFTLPGPQLLQPASSFQPVPQPQPLNSSFFDTLSLPQLPVEPEGCKPNRSSSNKGDSTATAWLCEEMGDLPQGHWGRVGVSG